jgi:EAL domain-containing protein (putative c-di-GMP-specific phosphodiesterase class I)/FixJ family two-component response regulator
MKLLLVDDESFALKLLTQQLARLGYDNVRSFERAAEAMEFLDADAHGFDLVFCDLQMPEVDGVEFVRHLAQVGYRGALVVVSGEDDRVLHAAEKLAQAHGMPVLGALSKPVTARRLREVMDRLVSMRQYEPGIERRTFSSSELARAIDKGELVNQYQPKVSMDAAALVGVEALVRWRHPQAGLVFPDQFIPVAEENGLIDALTAAVLDAALHQSRRWQDAGLALQMAVNVSMDSLASLDFPDMVSAHVGRVGIGMASLTLEITESRLMRDMRAQLDTLARLRLKRVNLSIDDFGTGHSSLVQLRDVPFNELKLDRSFVTGAAGNGSLKAIVAATLAMAGQLGMTSVAEGVESREDWDFLRRLGCDVAQGYFIARPMFGDDLPASSQDWEMRRGALTSQVSA